MSEGLLLAIEGGGTRTRVVLGDGVGNILRMAQGGPGSALYVDAATYPAELTRLLDDVLCHERPLRIGCGGPMNRSLVDSVLAAQLPLSPITWYSEGEIALGIYRLTWGIAVIGGTGSSARAIDQTGDWVEVGGFGPQFDDLGSAYWVAREAIGTALRSEHARGPATTLLEAVFGYFQLSDAWGLVPLCAGNGHLPVTTVAGFAREVARCADAGDPEAIRVLGEAGTHLADLVVAAARRSDLLSTLKVPVVPTGGLFRAKELVLGALEARLRQSGLDFVLHEPVPDPVPGLLNLLASN